MRRGIITLLPTKDKKNLLRFKNWRPISLLNTDYKILAKVLAFRLKKVLPSVIHEDQSGLISGRYIGDNIKLFIDVLHYFKRNDIPGLVLSIDFEKAFDKVESEFLYFVMKKFGFEEKFIRWIRLLYTDIRGAVARLVRRVPCNQEGPGSSPMSSIYVLQQDILSALLLSTQVYKWVPGRNGMSAPMWLPCLE